MADSIELLRLRAKAKAKAQAEAGRGLTGAQEETKEGFKTFGKGLWDVVTEVGSALDRVTGSPSRAAFMEVLKRPFLAQKLTGMVTEFSKQFGRDPAKAPTGDDISKEMGFSNKTIGDVYEEKGADPTELGAFANMSAAKAMGLVFDVGLDWSNIAPISTLTGAAGKVVKPVAGGLASGVAKGADLATGTRGASTAAEAAQAAAQAGREGLGATFKADVLTDYPETMQKAARAGIAPEDLPQAAKYGPESNISMMERSKAEGPLGQQTREMFKRNRDKLQAYAEEGISKIAVPMQAEVAGAHMREAFDSGLSKVFDSMDVTNRKIIEGVPGLKISGKARIRLQKQLNGLEQWAKRRAGSSNPTLSQQGQQILNAVENIRGTNYSYKQIYGELRDVGDIGFKIKNTMATVPPDQQMYRRLYANLNEALHKTVRDDVVGGAEILKDLRKNNRTMTDLYKKKDNVMSILGNPNLADDKAFSRMMGDTKKIRALKQILNPEDMNALKSSYLESLIKREPDGAFSLKLLFNKMQSSKAQVNALFNEKELKQIREAMDLADKFGYDKLSFSGTGQSNAFLQMLKSTGARMVEAAVGVPMKKAAKAKPAKIAPMFRTPKAYLNSPGSRLKALQVISVQRREGKSRGEALKGVFDTTGWSSHEVNKIGDLLVMKAGAKDQKMKNLFDRDIKKRLEKIQKRLGGQ